MYIQTRNVGIWFRGAHALQSSEACPVLPGLAANIGRFSARQGALSRKNLVWGVWGFPCWTVNHVKTVYTKSLIGLFDQCLHGTKAAQFLLAPVLIVEFVPSVAWFSLRKAVETGTVPCDPTLWWKRSCRPSPVSCDVVMLWYSHPPSNGSKILI